MYLKDNLIYWFQIRRARPDLSGICIFIERFYKFRHTTVTKVEQQKPHSFYKPLMPLASDSFINKACGFFITG